MAQGGPRWRDRGRARERRRPRDTKGRGRGGKVLIAVYPACCGLLVFALHGAILTRERHCVHRTMFRRYLPATNEEFDIDANRAAGPDGATAPRA